MLPKGADAIVMVEHTREHDDGTVAIEHAATAGQHVMHRGEDVRRGQIVLPRGRRFRPHDVGALSGIGLSRVRVYRRPRVAVIATGDEIVPPDVTPRPGQVRNVNQYALRALIEAEGGVPVDFGVLPDRRPVIARALARALRDADVVLMSGGSSVGVKDHTPAVVGGVRGARILVHGIRVKPGKPTLIARARGKAVLGLPGNPTSALVIFELFGVPLIRSVGGEPWARALAPRPRRSARLGSAVRSLAGREDWIRVRLDESAAGALVAHPVPGGSGEIYSFVRADGMVRIPAASAGLPAGAPVQVRLI
jgi:molybdopterin molybdotransferase